MLQDILKNHMVIKKLHSQLCGKWLCISQFWLHYLILYIIHDKQGTTGLPGLSPLVLDSALISLAIYFINVVSPVAERGCVEVLIQWVLSSLSQQSREAKANRNTDLIPFSCPSHGIHNAITLATRIEKGEERDFFKLSLDGLFMPSNLALFLDLKGTPDRLQRDSSTPCEWIHLHFLSCLCWEGARSLHVLQGPIQVSCLSRQKLRSRWPQALKVR